MRSDSSSISTKSDDIFWSADEADAFVQSEGVNTPAALRCAISLDLMTDPVRTEHAGCYERREIQKWVDHKKTDPLTNKKLEKLTLTPQGAMKEATMAFRDFCIKRHPGCDALFKAPAPAKEADAQAEKQAPPTSQEACRDRIRTIVQEVNQLYSSIDEHRRRARCAMNLGDSEAYNVSIAALENARVHKRELIAERQRLMAWIRGETGQELQRAVRNFQP